MLRKLLTLVVLALVAVFVAPPPLGATTATSTLTITAEVDSACQVSTTDVGFPTYQPLGANATTPDDSTSGSITVTCTTGAGAGQILVGKGHDQFNGQGRLHNTTVSGNYLTFILYQDASRLIPWDDVTGMTIPAAPSGSPRVFPVYGRLPAGQVVASGTYTDNVNVTLNF